MSLSNDKSMSTANDSLPVVIPVTKFRTEVLESQRPVLVEFWTGWSQSCRVFESVLQELAHDWFGKIKIVKINADDSLDLSLSYEIQSIPTLIYFVKGKPCVRIVGTASKEAIVAKLESFPM
jgi:thioredoxin 1